jgi:hypothetical protein
VKDEEKLGQLEEAGAPDRCEPACTAVRRPVKSNMSLTSETLSSCLIRTHSKRAPRASGSSYGVTLVGVLCSSALVHISSAGERANGCQEPLLRYH